MTCTPTDQKPGEGTLAEFSDEVRVSNGLGFTEDEGIFIDRPLVEQSRIVSGGWVAGLAVLNYNKKKNSWGWKALIVHR